MFGHYRFQSQSVTNIQHVLCIHGDIKSETFNNQKSEWHVFLGLVNINYCLKKMAMKIGS